LQLKQKLGHCLNSSSFAEALLLSGDMSFGSGLPRGSKQIEHLGKGAPQCGHVERNDGFLLPAVPLLNLDIGESDCAETFLLHLIH
jgi:hypothetical protein